MAASRPITIENIAEYKNFSIDLVVENNFTHYVKISIKDSHEEIQRIAIDPMDNTIAGTITIDAVAKLGADAQAVLDLFAEAMLTKLGAKQFLVIPNDSSLPGYTTPDQALDSKGARFERTMLGNPSVIQARANFILQRTPELLAELESMNLQVVIGQEALMADYDAGKRYNEMGYLLENAGFTKGKQEEYKAKNDTLSRTSNEAVAIVGIVNTHNELVGMMRALHMQNGMVYFSDEVMKQDLLSLDKFPGADDAAKMMQRKMFLLAFLVKKAGGALDNVNQMLIIAAEGREAAYEAIGFKRFPQAENDYKVMMKLSPRGPMLDACRKVIMELPEAVVAARPRSPLHTPGIGSFATAGIPLDGVGALANQTLVPRM